MKSYGSDHSLESTHANDLLTTSRGPTWRPKNLVWGVYRILGPNSAIVHLMENMRFALQLLGPRGPIVEPSMSRPVHPSRNNFS